MNAIIECPAQEVAGKLDRIEHLRDRLPLAGKILQGIAGELPPPLTGELDAWEEHLIAETERLRDDLSEVYPRSLEGAIAQIIVAERDWLSRDPDLQSRAISLIRHALAFLASNPAQCLNTDGVDFPGPSFLADSAYWRQDA